MKVELLHPAQHGTGRGQSVEYGRGVHDLPEALAKELLAIGKHHPDCPANKGGDCFQETVVPGPGENRDPAYKPAHSCDVIARRPVTKSTPKGQVIAAFATAQAAPQTTEKKK
jgi:hypothetical protein